MTSPRESLHAPTVVHPLTAGRPPSPFPLAGANVGASDKEGMSPLHWAANKGQVRAQQILMDGVPRARDACGSFPPCYAANASPS